MRHEDIELGEDAIEVERKPRAGVVISVRLSADEADRLQQLAEERKTTLSHVAHEALSAFLARDSRRASVAGP